MIEVLTPIETRPRLNHDAAVIGSRKHRPPPSLLYASFRERKATKSQRPLTLERAQLSP